MSFKQKLAKEVKAVALTTLYFAVWFGALVAMKRLILAEYEIKFRGLAAALIGALVAAKVVLVLEHVSLGQWMRKQAPVLEIACRTLLYMLGVFVALLLEKAFEARHEYGGFGAALVHVFRDRDVPHVWANTIGVGIALLGFNILAVVREHLGEGQFTRLMFSRRRGKNESKS